MQFGSDVFRNKIPKKEDVAQCIKAKRQSIKKSKQFILYLF